MIESVLKWLFIRYNQRVLSKDFYNSSLDLKNLKKEVTIYRDKWGISHIDAQNNQDLMFAQGFIHARDRSWQMEMNRRVAMGRVSELFGDIALDTDRLIRTLGFNRLAKQDYDAASDEMKNYLNCYSDGVNAFFNKGRLPIEFKLAKVKPEKWSPIDSLGWGRVMSWTLSHGWSGSITRQKIIDKVGIQKAMELSILYPEDNPVELPDGLEMKKISPDEMLKSVAGPFLGKDMDGGGRGSNAWAVSPKMSSTGRPILANDTHLVLSNPNVWYLNHLKSAEGLHVTGASLPGVLGVMVGHNQNIGWGITIAYTDVEDIFIEKIDPSDSNRYFYKDSKRTFHSIEEKIYIKGKSKPHVENVKYSIHGPIISKVLEKKSRCLSLCSKSLNILKVSDGILNMNLALDYDSFSKAVDSINGPQLNIIYSDTKGNIGLFITGEVPIRLKGDGQLPVDGSTGEFDWDGIIPVDQMPRLLNPEKGYIISCNNKIIDNNYPYFLGNSFMNGYRASRIDSIFASSSKISIEMSKKLHLDIFSIPAEKFVKGMIKGFRTAKPNAQFIIDKLLDWDFNLDKCSKEATIYQVLMYTIIRKLVEEDLGKELTDEFMGVGKHPLLLPTSELLGHTIESLFQILQNPNSLWLKSNKEIVELLEDSMVSTYNWLNSNFENESDWEWGKIHKVTFRHGMSVKKPLEKILNIGPFSVGGDTDTVFQTAYNPSSPYHATEWCPALRLVMDIGKWDNSCVISPPGQVGVVGSKHFDDLASIWLEGDYVPMLWSDDQVKLHSMNKLKIFPKGNRNE